jgi:hypothetical protein
MPPLLREQDLLGLACRELRARDYLSESRDGTLADRAAAPGCAFSLLQLLALHRI